MTGQPDPDTLKTHECLPPKEGESGRQWSLPGGPTLWSLGGLAAGVAAGMILDPVKDLSTNPVLATLSGIGTMWMSALRMLALPLAVGNTICAVARDRTSRAGGRILGAVAVYLVLLLIGATSVLLVVPRVLRVTPVDQAAVRALSKSKSEPVPAVAGEARPAPGLGEMVIGLVPRNLLESGVKEEFLRLLVFGILFGLALRRVSPEKGGTVIRFLEGVTEALMVLVRWIILCSPVAMFAVAAVFAAKAGMQVAGILGEFVVLECSLMLAFLLLLYPLTTLAGGVSLRAFGSSALGPQLVAISTRSSLACLPSLLEAGRDLLPSNPEPSRVVLPVAVSMFKVNRTTSALCRVLVIAYFWSVPVGATQIAAFLFTVILLSFSDLGLPSNTQLRTVPAYLAAGCPIEAVMLLEVIEPFSDICKTLLNVTGDLSVAAIVTRWSRRPATPRAMSARAGAQ